MMPPVGKSGPGTKLQQRLGARRSRVLDEMERGVAELGGIVRRDVGRHADGDAGEPLASRLGKAPGSTPARSSSPS